MLNSKRKIFISLAIICFSFIFLFLPTKSIFASFCPPPAVIHMSDAVEAWAALSVEVTTLTKEMQANTEACIEELSLSGITMVKAFAGIDPATMAIADFLAMDKEIVAFTPEGPCGKIIAAYDKIKDIGDCKKKYTKAYVAAQFAMFGMQMVTNITNMAGQTAMYTLGKALAGDCEGPCWSSQHLGDMLETIGNNVLGEAIGTVDNMTGGAFDLCSPDPELQLQYALGLFSATAPKPKCDWQSVKANYANLGAEIQSGEFWKRFNVSISDPKNTDLGGFMDFMVEAEAKKKREEAKIFAEEIRAGTDWTSGFIGAASDKDLPRKTWEFIYNKTGSKLDALSASQYQVKYQALINEAHLEGTEVWEQWGMYLGTSMLQNLTDSFVSAYMKKLYAWIFGQGQDVKSLLVNPGGESFLTNKKVGGGYSQGEEGGKDLLASINKVQLIPEDNYNILSDLMVCPPQGRNVYNCSIDPNFATAVSNKLTVKEAMDQGFLDGGKPFGWTSASSGTEPDWQTGYGYNNMKKLRFAGIIPVGWEMAAEWIRDKTKSAANDGGVASVVIDSYTLQEVAEGFYKTAAPLTANGKPDPNGTEPGLPSNIRICDDGTILDKASASCPSGKKVARDGALDDCDISLGASPFCHLVDPEWVLKIPLARCRNMALGDMYGNSSRSSYCADLQQCVSEGDNGSCDAWGYCDRSKNIWQFDSKACPSEFASCEKLERTSNSGSFAYLKSTLDFSSCNADNSGCKWYGYQKLATSANIAVIPLSFGPDAKVKVNGLSWNWDYKSPLYLARSASEKTCDQNNGGCSEFLSPTVGSGFNFIKNGSFEKTDQFAEGNNNYTYAFGWDDINTAGDKNITLKTDGGYIGDNYIVLDNKKLSFDVNVGAEAAGRTFTFSFFARDFSDGDKFSLGDYTSTVGKDGIQPSADNEWTRYSISRSYPIINRSVIIPLTIDCKNCNIDGVSFEENNTALGYNEYGDGTDQIYLKKPPSYYNCLGRDAARPFVDPGIDGSCPEGLTKYEAGEGSYCYKELTDWSNGLLSNNDKTEKLSEDNCLASNGAVYGEGDNKKCYEIDPPECAKYATVCSYREVGCHLYTADKTKIQIAAKGGPADVCPAECAGYDTFSERASYFESSKYPLYLIPNSARSCSAVNAGCSQFTNLDKLTAGGEGVEYYSYLRQCFKPRDKAEEGSQCAPYYTWEGSDTTGYQLKVYELKTTAGGRPDLTNYDNEDSAAGGIYPGDCSEQYGIDPDCYQFYDSRGNIIYRYYSRTITCSDNCHPYRKTKSESGGTSSINDSQDCLNSNGQWTSEGCVYTAIPEEGVSCPANENSCREYRGDNAGFSGKIFTSRFENLNEEICDLINSNGSTGNQSNCWKNTVVSTESLLAGGHSGRLKFGADKMIRKVEPGVIQNGGFYLLNFSVKNSENEAAIIDIRFAGVAMDDNSHAFVNRMSIPADGQWHYYRVGPVRVEGDWAKDGVTEINFVTLNKYKVFFDDVSLEYSTDTAFLIKNSWTTPASCDRDESGSPAPQYMLGCEAYTDENSTGKYFKSFSQLCNQSHIGCSALIDTYNSSSVFPSVYNVKCTLPTLCNDEAGCDCANSKYPLHKCTVNYQEKYCFYDFDNPPVGAFSGDDFSAETINFVRGDQFSYYVNSEKFQCGASEKGCTGLGVPVNVDSSGVPGEWSEVYYILNPDNFATTLCSSLEGGCDSFKDDQGGMYYFKDPGAKTCEYRTGQGWFKSGSTSPSPDCPISWYNVPDSTNKIYNGWAKTCPAEQNGCTDFIYPKSQLAGSDSENEHYYFINDSTVENCDGVNEREGCVLFQNTDLTNWKTRQITTYYSKDASNRASVKNGYQKVPAVDCSKDDPDPLCYFWNGSAKDVLKNDANEIIKVKRDRSCSEWLTCLTSQQQNTGTGDSKQVYLAVAGCRALNPENKSECSDLVYNQKSENPQRLTLNLYQSRNIEYSASEEYIGYSLPNWYPLSYLYQAKTGYCAGGSATKGKGGMLTVPISLRCVDDSDCGIGQTCKFPANDEYALIYKNAKTGDIESPGGSYKFVSKTCRAYPESDAPFSMEVKGKDGYENANTCVDSVEGDNTLNPCDCHYQKLDLTTGTAYYQYNKVLPTRVCNATSEDGGCTYGACRKVGEPCSEDRDCVSITDDVGYDTSKQGQQAPSELFDASKYDHCVVPEKTSITWGWKGYCLGYDSNTVINGNTAEHPCYAWFPLDIIQGEPNIYDFTYEAGFYPSKPLYYCLRAEAPPTKSRVLKAISEPFEIKSSPQGVLIDSGYDKQKEYTFGLKYSNEVTEGKPIAIWTTRAPEMDIKFSEDKNRKGPEGGEGSDNNTLINQGFRETSNGVGVESKGEMFSPVSAILVAAGEANSISDAEKIEIKKDLIERIEFHCSGSQFGRIVNGTDWYSCNGLFGSQHLGNIVLNERNNFAWWIGVDTPPDLRGRDEPCQKMHLRDIYLCVNPPSHMNNKVTVEPAAVCADTPPDGWTYCRYDNGDSGVKETCCLQELPDGEYVDIYNKSDDPNDENNGKRWLYFDIKTIDSEGETKIIKIPIEPLDGEDGWCGDANNSKFILANSAGRCGRTHRKTYEIDKNLYCDGSGIKSTTCVVQKIGVQWEKEEKNPVCRGPKEGQQRAIILKKCPKSWDEEGWSCSCPDGVCTLIGPEVQMRPPVLAGTDDYDQCGVPDGGGIDQGIPKPNCDEAADNEYCWDFPIHFSGKTLIASNPEMDTVEECGDLGLPTGGYDGNYYPRGVEGGWNCNRADAGYIVADFDNKNIFRGISAGWFDSQRDTYFPNLDVTIYLNDVCRELAKVTQIDSETGLNMSYNYTDMVSSNSPTNQSFGGIKRKNKDGLYLEPFGPANALCLTEDGAYCNDYCINRDEDTGECLDSHLFQYDDQNTPSLLNDGDTLLTNWRGDKFLWMQKEIVGIGGGRCSNNLTEWDGGWKTGTVANIYCRNADGTQCNNNEAATIVIPTINVRTFSLLPVRFVSGMSAGFTTAGVPISVDKKVPGAFVCSGYGQSSISKKGGLGSENSRDLYGGTFGCYTYTDENYKTLTIDGAASGQSVIRAYSRLADGLTCNIKGDPEWPKCSEINLPSDSALDAGTSASQGDMMIGGANVTLGSSLNDAEKIMAFGVDQKGKRSGENKNNGIFAHIFKTFTVSPHNYVPGNNLNPITENQDLVYTTGGISNPSFDLLKEAGVAPKVAAVAQSVGDNKLIKGADNTFSINFSSGYDVYGYGSKLLNIQFYGYNEDGNQMPIKRVAFDPGIVNSNGSHNTQFYIQVSGSYRNKMWQDACDNSNFGRTTFGCETGYFNFIQTYTCEGESDPNWCGKGDGDKDNCNGIDIGACVYQPRIQLMDNWEYCTGSCFKAGVGGACWGDPENELHKEDGNCGLGNINAWIKYNANVVIFPKQ